MVFLLGFGVLSIFSDPTLDCMKLLMIDDEHYVMKPTPNTLLTYILRYTKLAI